jgi:uncharacterized protein (DUF4415 family)
MKACCCALPYMNPDACKYCGNNKEFNEVGGYLTHPVVDWVKPIVMPLTPEQKELFAPKIKKEVIEKFDKDGKLIERITKEI